MHSITTLNRQYWFKLIKLYEIIGNTDALHGIWCQLAQQDGVMFREHLSQPSLAGDQHSQEHENLNPNSNASASAQETF